VLKQLLRVIEGFLVWFGGLIVQQEKVNIRRLDRVRVERKNNGDNIGGH
jgi:chloramphenicol 3-O-phosphotransferase